MLGPCAYSAVLHGWQTFPQNGMKVKKQKEVNQRNTAIMKRNKITTNKKQTASVMVGGVQIRPKVCPCWAPTRHKQEQAHFQGKTNTTTNCIMPTKYKIQHRKHSFVNLIQKYFQTEILRVLQGKTKVTTAWQTRKKLSLTTFTLCWWGQRGDVKTLVVTVGTAVLKETDSILTEDTVPVFRSKCKLSIGRCNAWFSIIWYFLSNSRCRRFCELKE